MFNLAAYLMPLVLVVPFIVQNNVESAADAQLAPAPPTEHASVPADWLTLDDAAGVPTQQQIRIERRVVIRISPYRPSSRSARTNFNADAPRQNQSQRPERKLVERKVGKCLPMESIAAVRTTQDNRLLLYMNDQRLIAASLEKACSARDFYQGFYVEPSKDGNLCVERDRLQSRTGVKCKMRRIRQLVPETT